MYCHSLIKKTAMEMAGEVYEHWAKNDEFYKVWPKEREFIALKWGLFCEAARATLAGMLALPIDEGQKALIHEALILDNPLRTNRLSHVNLG